MADWKELRERDYREYCRNKIDFADWYINKVEQYMITGEEVMDGNARLS